MSNETEAGCGSVAPTVERPVRRLYVFDARGSHVRLDLNGCDIYADVLFAGRSYHFTADKDGLSLLKKACAALLNDAGA